MKIKRNRILTYATLILFVLGMFLCVRPVSAATLKCKHGATISANLGDKITVNQKGISKKTLKSTYTWIGFKAKKDGILRVSTEDYSGYIRLANSKKTLLSGTEEMLTPSTLLGVEISYGMDYGIKKGEKYYLRIEGYTESPVEVENYTIHLKFISQSITGGSKKAKAKTIKKKKWTKGLLTIGKKNARWYKIKLTKKQKVNIYMNAYGNGNIYFYIWTKKAGGVTRRVFQDNVAETPNKAGWINWNTKCVRSPKLPKGTVIYIKAYTKGKESSGHYEIKWK